MIKEILSNYLPQPIKRFTLTLLAQCGEGKLSHLMVDIASKVELSSLPMMNDGAPTVEFSLSSTQERLVDTQFKLITDFLISEEIGYTLL